MDKRVMPEFYKTATSVCICWPVFGVGYEGKRTTRGDNWDRSDGKEMKSRQGRGKDERGFGVIFSFKPLGKTGLRVPV